ncbi:hypothetical protein N7540_003841 [Penicillium herquei]|nr:hypothetical protein N7540_003841 [Penicillium herquei]
MQRMNLKLTTKPSNRLSTGADLNAIALTSRKVRSIKTQRFASSLTLDQAYLLARLSRHQQRGTSSRLFSRRIFEHLIYSYNFKVRGSRYRDIETIRGKGSGMYWQFLCSKDPWN